MTPDVAASPARILARGAPRALRSGAIAGAISAFAFAAIHHLLISDIWFSLLPMLFAGAACGACLAWSYRRLFAAPTVRTWLGYNLVHVALLALLGLASILVFEPVTTIAALVEADGPPSDLIAQATPLTLAFTLGSVLLLSALWGRTLTGVAAIALTCVVLVLLVGLNVSALGLVHLPSGALYLVVEMFGLIFALAAVFALAYLMLERGTSSSL